MFAVLPTGPGGRSTQMSLPSVVRSSAGRFGEQKGRTSGTPVSFANS